MACHCSEYFVSFRALLTNGKNSEYAKLPAFSYCIHLSRCVTQPTFGVGPIVEGQIALVNNSERCLRSI